MIALYGAATGQTDMEGKYKIIAGNKHFFT